MGGMGPMFGQAGHFRFYAPEPIPTRVERHDNEMHRLYGVLDRRLEGREFICDDYSIADMACWPWVITYKRQEVDLDQFPNVKLGTRHCSSARRCGAAMLWGRSSASPPATGTRKRAGTSSPTATPANRTEQGQPFDIGPLQATQLRSVRSHVARLDENGRMKMTDNILRTEDALREVYGHASGRAATKAIPSLDPHCRRFIELSPFLVMGSAAKDGPADVSPKGDLPGFVQVLDDHTLVIPDRPGNRRID